MKLNFIEFWVYFAKGSPFLFSMLMLLLLFAIACSIIEYKENNRI